MPSGRLLIHRKKFAFLFISIGFLLLLLLLLLLHLKDRVASLMEIGMRGRSGEGRSEVDQLKLSIGSGGRCRASLDVSAVGF